MQKKNQGQKKEQTPEPVQGELSSIWQELLGHHPVPDSAPAGEANIPTLETDPWSTLLHAKGVEVFDMQSAQLRISDQEVEQVLEVMQEQPDQDLPDKHNTRFAKQ